MSPASVSDGDAYDFPCLSLQVVFLGLDTVVPLMTGELLHFPKLIRAFFSLITYMLEVYPERVASLPGGCPCSVVRACCACTLRLHRVASESCFGIQIKT